MRIRYCLANLTRQLAKEGIPDSDIEAEVLLRHVLGLDRARFFAALERPVEPSQRENLRRLAKRRSEGEPLAYILGHREFYGLDFVVNRHVLIPRQETELLVDKVLERHPGSASAVARPEFAPGRGGAVEIADVGTGCGAIAVAIACNLPEATVYATDVSREALRVADINRRHHGVAHRVHLIQGDLLEAVNRAVSVVVSNPPYIETGEIAGLSREIKREPASALDGGENGLAITGLLLSQAAHHIRPGGSLLVEIAPARLDQVMQLARRAVPGSSVTFTRDLLGLPRVVSVEVPRAAG